MAYPISTMSVKDRFDNIEVVLNNIRDHVNDLIAKSAITRSQALDTFQSLVSRINDLTTLTANAATNGLVEYARLQKNDNTLDPVAEYQAIMSSLVDLRTWVINNFPKDVNGVCAVVTIDTTGVQKVNLTAGQLAAFKSQLSAVSATMA